MDMFGKFKSIFGYENNEDEKNKIDSYGVDHSNFSLRDEIEYQMARVNREDQFKQSYNNQGITDNYPQFGKSFWGNSSENNYGFGSSNISENIEQMKEKGFPTLEETLQYQNQMNGQNSMTTPTPWGQSSLGQNNATTSTEYGQNITSQLRPLTEAQKAQPSNRGNGVFGSGLEGLGKGAIYGAARPLNGASFGAVDWADRQLGGNLNQLGQEIQQDADTAGVGTLNRLTNLGLEVAGGLASGDEAWNMAKNAGEQAIRWNGRRQLLNQLQRGKDFRDVNLGYIAKKQLDEINNLRKLEGVSKIGSRKVSIPSDCIEHVFERRILNNGYKPQEVVDVLDNAIFRTEKINPTRYKTLQELSNQGTRHTNSAIVGKIRDGEHIFVKTGYKNK